jgi:hypothetical protein
VPIHIFDDTGALVATVIDETRAAGAHADVRWNGQSRGGMPAATGVYFYRLTTEQFTQTRKMLLLK